MSDIKDHLNSLRGVEVVDFEVERVRRATDNSTVTPEMLMALVVDDIRVFGDVTGCYVTLIRGAEQMETVNYKANMSLLEEIAWRSLGVRDAEDRAMGPKNDHEGPDAS